MASILNLIYRQNAHNDSNSRMMALKSTQVRRMTTPGACQIVGLCVSSDVFASDLGINMIYYYLA